MTGVPAEERSDAVGWERNPSSGELVTPIYIPQAPAQAVPLQTQSVSTPSEGITRTVWIPGLVLLETILAGSLDSSFTARNDGAGEGGKKVSIQPISPPTRFEREPYFYFERAKKKRAPSEARYCGPMYWTRISYIFGGSFILPIKSTVPEGLCTSR